MEALDEKMVKANNDAAVWIVKGFVPGRFAQGAIASADGGAPSYPASPALGLMHAAAGNNVSDFLTGKKSAVETLNAIEAEYNTKAKETGLLK
jgi:hypothetical protein